MRLLSFLNMPKHNGRHSQGELQDFDDDFLRGSPASVAVEEIRTPVVFSDVAHNGTVVLALLSSVELWESGLLI